MVALNRTLVSSVLVVALLAPGAPGAADDGWRTVTERNGVTLEKRPVADSRYFEYRARGHTTVAAAVAAQRIWSGIGDERSPPLKHRSVLRRGEDELVVYDQIHTPVVSDRDVTIRLRRVSDARTGAFEIQFESTAELGPPPAAGYVRLPKVRGAWRIEPDPAGGANLAYLCYSEPGGAIPAFMVRGAQQDQTIDEFERVLNRVGR